MIVYRIKQISTGLFFSGHIWSTGFTKKGLPRKIGPYKYLPVFLKEEDAGIYGIEELNYQIENAIRRGTLELFNDTEIIAYKRLPVKTTVKIKNLRERHEAKIIIEKLKSN